MEIHKEKKNYTVEVRKNKEKYLEPYLEIESSARMASGME